MKESKKEQKKEEVSTEETKKTSETVSEQTEKTEKKSEACEADSEKKEEKSAEPTDADLNPDNIEVFDEQTAPVTKLTSMGTKTKSEQDLSIKALDMSLDVVKLLSGYKVETVFKVAALLQRYIASGESK